MTQSPGRGPDAGNGLVFQLPHCFAQLGAQLAFTQDGITEELLLAADFVFCASERVA